MLARALDALFPMLDAITSAEGRFALRSLLHSTFFVELNRQCAAGMLG
jgi:hypothetical protein